MKRKLTFIFIFLFMLGTLTVLYVNKFFFPVKFKEIIIEKSQEYLDRKVVIESIQANLLKGFVLNDLIIYKKNSDVPLLKAKTVYFKVILTPLFKKQTVFIPSLTIENPIINIDRDKKARWNFSDLLPDQSSKDKKSKFSAAIGALTINNAALTFTDESLPSPLIEKIVNINLKAKISIAKVLHFIWEAYVPKHASSFVSEGTFHLSKKELSNALKVTNFPPEEYLNRYVTAKNFTLKNGNLKTADIHLDYKNQGLNITGGLSLENAHFLTEKDTDFKGNIDVLLGNLQWKDNRMEIQSNLHITETKLQFEKNKEFLGNVSTTNMTVLIDNGATDLTGDFEFKKSQLKLGKAETLQANPKVSLKYRYDPSSNERTNYEGSAEFRDGILTGIQNTGKITNIEGIVHFKRNNFTSDLLKFTSHDSDIEVSGSIRDLKKPNLDIKAFSKNLNLDALPILFPDAFKTRKFKLQGRPEAQFSYTGLISSPLKAKIDILLSLKDSLLKSETFSITKISGKLGSTEHKIFWKDLTGTLQDKIYILNGESKGLLKPLIETNIKTDEFNFDTRFRFSNNVFDVIALTGRYFNSDIDLNGNIDISSSTKNPFMNLKGAIGLNFDDLPFFFSHLQKKLEKFNPKGILNTDVVIKGYLNNWRDWFLVLTAKSPYLRIAGHALKNTTIKYNQRREDINELDLSSTVYNGTLGVTGSTDLTQEKIPYRLNAKLNGMDLAELKKNMNWKDKNLSGIASGSAILKGSLKNLEDINGDGSISIKGGRLWEMSLLEGLGKFLFIREFGNIVFEEASADFIVTDKGLSTDNLLLTSNLINLIGGGRIGFDKSINFHIRSEIIKENIDESSSFRELMTSKIFTQPNNFLNIRISGTLDDPKYFVLPPSVNVVEEATDIILDGLQNIFE